MSRPISLASLVIVLMAALMAINKRRDTGARLDAIEQRLHALEEQRP